MKKIKILVVAAFAMFAISCGNNAGSQDNQSEAAVVTEECGGDCSSCPSKCGSDTTAQMASDSTTCCSKATGEKHECTKEECASCKDKKGCPNQK